MQLLRDASISKAAASSPDACARAMLDGLPQVMWFIRRQMRGHRNRAVSVPQFRTLVLLDRYPTASLSAVAENLGATLPTASRMVTGLVTKGLVARKACPTDRRQACLVLTARGRTVLNTAQRATRDGVAAEVARLSPDQRATITRAMTLLQDVFGTTTLPGGADAAPPAEDAPDSN